LESSRRQNEGAAAEQGWLYAVPELSDDERIALTYAAARKALAGFEAQMLLEVGSRPRSGPRTRTSSTMIASTHKRGIDLKAIKTTHARDCMDQVRGTILWSEERQRTNKISLDAVAPAIAGNMPSSWTRNRFHPEDIAPPRDGQRPTPTQDSADADCIVRGFR
jgi:hypothetical protein